MKHGNEGAAYHGDDDVFAYASSSRRRCGMRKNMRKSGIGIIGDIPPGTHFCQFSQTKEDILDTLVPYFKTGLENNEFCIWITSKPLDVEEAKETLRKSVPDFDTYLKKGQIEIVPYTDWYVKEGVFDSERALNGLAEKVNQSLAIGYSGLRLAQNICWLEKEGWNDFVDYETRVDSVIDKHPIIALCTYSLDMCNATEIIDIITNHQFSLVKNEGKWQWIGSSWREDVTERKQVDEALRESERKYHLLFENMLDGFAYCRMLYDDCGHPVDFIYLDTNSSFELLTGLKEVTGKRATEAIPGIKKLHPELFDAYGRVSLTGQPERFEIEFKPLGIWLWISVYSPEREHFVAVFDNITEHKRAEEALRERESSLARSQEIVHLGSWELDVRTNRVRGSNELYRMFNLEPDVTLDAYIEKFHPDDRARVVESINTAIYDGKPYNIDYRIIPSPGEVRSVHAEGETTRDNTGRPLAFFGTVQDITERKEADEALRKSHEQIKEQSEKLQLSNEELKAQSEELHEANEALIESEKRFRTLSENSPDVIVRFDRQKRHLYANPAAAELHGRSPEKIVGKTNSELGMDPDLVKLWQRHYENVFTTGKPETMEFHYKSPQGKKYYFNTQIVPEFVYGKVTSVLAISHDNTDIKEAEARLKETLDNLEEKVKERTAELEKAYKKLEESEKGLAEAQRMVHLGSWDRNLVTDELYWSDELYRIFGLNPEEPGVTYDVFLSCVHPDDRDYLESAVKEVLNGLPLNIDYRILSVNGEERIVHAQGEAIFDERRTPVRTIGTIQDITERKKAEEKIQNLANIVESSYDAIITKSLDNTITSWNKGAEQIYGYSAGEVLGKPISILEPSIVVEETEELTDLIKQGDKIHSYETLRLRKDGTIINVSLTLSPLYDASGELNAISVIARDITKSKKEEEKLRKSEERYRIVIQQTGQIVYDYDSRTDKGSWAGAIEEVTGYSFEELQKFGKDFWIKNVHRADTNYVDGKFQDVRKTGGRFKEELRLRRKDGTCIYIENSGVSLTDHEDQPYGAIGVLKDITRARLAENQLQESEEIYRIATEQTGQVIFDFNLETCELRLAGAVREVTGYGPEELENLDKSVLIEYVHPEDRMELLDCLKKSFEEENKFRVEFRFRKKGGNYIYAENYGSWMKDDKGNVYRAIGVIKNITELKLEIKKVEESERKYCSFIQNLHGIAFQTDENFVTLFMHGAVKEITGYSEEELISRIKWKDIIHPDDLSLIIRKEEKIQSTRSSDYEEIEYRIKHRDGRIRWINEIYQKIQGEDGKPEFYQGMIYDVTDRKETEKFLSNIETARKQEIHHRIKNNLQVVSSLLDLQAEKFNNRECIKDSEILEAFRESQDRVIAMALIHEELYKGGGLDTLNFSSYIEELVENLFKTYRLGNKDTRLDMDLKENIFFDMDTAVPLGTIINELVSNSLKYAFADRDHGRIRIKLCIEESRERKDNREENNNVALKGTSFILIVSDNGVGVPESFDLESPEGLGLQLVTTLVDQLDGELELKRDKGTEFIIRFTVVKS